MTVVDVPLGLSGSTGRTNSVAIDLGSSGSTGLAAVPKGSPVISLGRAGTLGHMGVIGRHRYTVDLYEADGVTFRRSLLKATGIAWQREISKPGAGSFLVPVDDAATPDVHSPRIVAYREDGTIRMKTRVGAESLTMKDGKKWLSFDQQPGILALLGDAEVRPTFGEDHASTGTRTIGWMSYGKTGLLAGFIRPPYSLAFNSDTGRRAGYPKGSGFDSSNAYWISRWPIYGAAPSGAITYSRQTLYLPETRTVKIVVCADDFPGLWVDEQQLITVSEDTAQNWRQYYSVIVTLSAGNHVIAVSGKNGKARPGQVNPTALIWHVWPVDSRGIHVGSAPLIKSDPVHTWIYGGPGTPGPTGAAVIIQLYGEARDRGIEGVKHLKLGFTQTHDSHGEAWDDRNEYSFAIGASLTDVISNVVEVAGIDVDVDYRAMTVKAFKRQGHDKSSTVTLKQGNDADANITALSEQVIPPRFNRLRIGKANGTYLTYTHNASKDQYGILEATLAMGEIHGDDTPASVATRLLNVNALPLATTTVDLDTGKGPQPEKEFSVGDSVSVQNTRMTAYAKSRCMRLTTDATNPKTKKTVTLVTDRS